MAPKEAKDDKEKKEKKEKSEKKEKKEKKEDADGGEKKEKKSRIKEAGGMSLWESTGDAATMSYGAAEPQDKRDKEKKKEQETAKHVAEGKGLMKASDVIKETMGKMNEEKKAAKKVADDKAAKEAKDQAKTDAMEAEGAAEEREEFQIMDNSGLGNFMDKIQVTDIMKSTVAEASSSSSSRCQISASTKRGDPIFIGKKTSFISLGDFSFVKGFVYIRGPKDEQGVNLTLNRPSVVYVCHSKRPNDDDPWLQKWDLCQMQLPEFDESAAEVVVARKKAYKSPDNRVVALPRPPPGIETVIVFVAPDFHADVFTGTVELTEEEALEKARLDGAAARAARSGETAGKKEKKELTLEEVLSKVERNEKLSGKEKKMHEKHLEKNKVWAVNAQDQHDAQTGSAGMNAFSISMAGKNDPPANGDAITCEGFTISAPGQVLFDNVDLTIVQGKRYGILGPNGQGKTTLLRHLAARELPIPLNWDVILVEQEAKASSNTAVEEVLASDQKTADLLKREAELIKQLEDADESKGDTMSIEDMQKCQQELSMIAADLEASGADSAEANVRKILCGLGFTNGKPDEDRFSMDRPVQEFSGGWRMRISLAKALFLQPKLLMLDEPTNHLDLDAVLWLDRYLSEQYPHAVIVVSHDADFLDSIVTDILHLENKKLKHYRGDYTAFRKMHAQNRVQLDKEYKKQQDELKALKKKGKTNDEAHELVKKKFNIDNLDGLMEKLKDYVVKFKFYGHGKDQTIGGVNMTEVAFSYNGKEPWLLEDCEMGVDCASRIAIVGPNGAGKSTLLNLMMQTLEPCLGDVAVSKGLRVKQYHQHFEELLPLERDPVDYLVNAFNLSPPEKARGVLGQFGLPGASHFTKIGNLSGGQKARVAFSALMLMNPHIMVLDEPTNHLDIESVEALTDAIKAFNGGLVLVTHDARLITEIDCDIWVVEDGGCYKFEKYKNQEGFEGYRDKVIGQLEERQAEVERNETKRREARQKQRAKLFTEEQALAAKKQLKIDDAAKKEEAEKQAQEGAKAAKEANAAKAAEAAKQASKEEAKQESSEEDSDEDEDEAEAKEKTKEAEAKRKAAEKEAETKRKEAEAAAKTKASKPTAAPCSGGSKAALRAELEAEKKSALRKRAVADGVDEEALEEADDADDPKEAFIELILAMAPEDGEEEENGESDNSALRTELEALKKSALRKRAAGANVAEDDLEEADDDDDPKEAFIKLILEAEGGKGKSKNEEATAAAKKKAEAEETKKKEEEAKKAAKEEAAKKKVESDNDDDEDDEDEDEDDLIALAMQRKALAKKQKAVVEDEEEDGEAAPPPESVKKDDFSDDDKKKGKKGKKAPPAPKGKPKAKGKAPAGKNAWEESDDDDQQDAPEDADDPEKDNAEEEDDAKKKGGKKVAAKTKPNKKKEGGAEKKAREAREAAGEDEEPDDAPKKPQGKKGTKGGSDDEEGGSAPKAKSKSKAKKVEEEEDFSKAKGKKGKKGEQEKEEEEEEKKEQEEKEEPATEDGKKVRKKEKGPKKKEVEGEEKAETKGAQAAAAPPPSKPKQEDADDVDALVVSGEVASCDALRKKGNFLLSITVGSRQVQIVASSEVEVGKKVKLALEGATLENGKTVKREKIAGEWSEGSLI